MNLHRWLLCGGIHGRFESLERLRRAVVQRRAEGVLFVGGVLAPARSYSIHATPWGMTRTDGLFAEKFFQTLGKLGVFSAIIPGWADASLDEFLRMGMAAELEYPGVHLVHATLVEKGDVAIYGLGGYLRDGPAYERDSYSRVMSEYLVRALSRSQRPRKVLLLSRPPRGPLGGPEGSEALSDLIDSTHPTLCVVGGAQKSRGVRRMGRSLIVNPGYLSADSAAWLDWTHPAEGQVEILNLSPERLQNVPFETGFCI
jgi:Icc-related predicted phosphoesterase